MSNTINPNKTFEIYNYEDSSAKTEINFNDEIIFNQIDIENIRFFYKHGIIFIEGYIRHGDSINEENILKLNQWSRESGSSNKWLKRTNIKIVRNGFVVRDVVFNAFIVDYLEHFNKGKHRFTLILRQYKLARLDGIIGETGTNRTETYISKTKIKKLETTIITSPLDGEAVFFSGLNMVSGVLFLKQLANGFTGTKKFMFFMVAHGTGVITEVCADVKFVITGNPEKIGSYNMTRDEFYKPLGKIIATKLNKINTDIKISENIGEDSYNSAQLIYSWFNIGEKIINGTTNLYKHKGLDILYTIKLKEVKVSKFGRRILPQKVIGATPIITLKNIIKEIITEIYPTVKATKEEIKKQGEK